jgi:hypothetical protein
MKTKITMAAFSLILLSAHFSYMKFPLVLSIITLAAPLLFFYKKRFSLYIIQIILYLGALEWIRAMIIHIQQHLAAGQPWVRLVIILSLVVMFTLYSAWSLSSASLRGNYR